MRTVGELLETLLYYKENYPEFEKYNVCIDIAPEDAEYPILKDINLYVNTDIGQVEIMPKNN